MGVLARVLTRHGNRVGALMYGAGVDTVIPARPGRRQVEAIFAGELDALARDERDETLSALEAMTSFEVVDQLRTHRRLASTRVEAVLARSVIGVLTAP